mgnify:CR=1 FL=1
MSLFLLCLSCSWTVEMAIFQLFCCRSTHWPSCPLHPYILLSYCSVRWYLAWTDSLLFHIMVFRAQKYHSVIFLGVYETRVTFLWRQTLMKIPFSGASVAPLLEFPSCFCEVSKLEWAHALQVLSKGNVREKVICCDSIASTQWRCQIQNNSSSLILFTSYSYFPCVYL